MISDKSEDMELIVQCALNGIKISYLNDTIFYDEHEVDFNASVKQRKRWSYGTLKCLKFYCSRLLRKDNFRYFNCYCRNISRNIN